MTLFNCTKDLCIERTNIDDLVSFVFIDLQQNYKNVDYFKDWAILCTKNKTVDFLNSQILNTIPEEEVTFLSKNSSNYDEANSLYPIEFLNEYNQTIYQNWLKIFIQKTLYKKSIYI